MRKIFYLLVILVHSTFLFGQKDKTDANIYGHVINKSDGKHIPFVTIGIKGTSVGGSADATGHFYLKNLPVGEHTFVASGVGFNKQEKKIILELGKTYELNFELEETSLMLQSTVVTASRNESTRDKAPALVNLITVKNLESANAVCLAQGLGFQPGLRVESNCQNCGFQQVRMNGLEGQYSQILIDSRPIFSALASVYGLEQIPTNMIDRIEVMRGGGSAIFGSNAIAGTINIITKEPVSNQVSINNTTNLIGGKSFDINTHINASVVSDNHKSGFVLFGGTRQRQPYDHDKDGFSEIGIINAKNIGFRGFYNTSTYSRLVVEYHAIEEFRRGGNEFELPAHETDITEQTNHVVNNLSAKWNTYSKDNVHKLSIYAAGMTIDRSSYYGAQKDPDAYGVTYDRVLNVGAQYTYNMDKLLFMPAELTVGAEFLHNKLEDKMLGYGRQIEQEINTASLFAQNEWKNDDLSLLVGARMDKVNIIDNPVISPRLNFRYSITPIIIARASYSTGFRAPQTFDEDLHVSAVGGGGAIIFQDENLKTEKSQSISASGDFYHNFGNVQTNLLIEGFYTRLNNIFKLESQGVDASGNLILLRTNGRGAVVKGINFEYQIVPNNKIDFQAGFTIQRSQYLEPEAWSIDENVPACKTMFRSPNNYGFFTSNWQMLNKTLLSLSGTYTGSMVVQHFAGYIDADRVERTKDFFDLIVKVEQQVNINGQMILNLNAGVMNVFNSYQKDFDKGEFRDANFIYGPSLPRTYFVGLKLDL